MNPSAQSVFLFGPFRFDAGQQLLFRDGELVPLAPKVATTLYVLLEHHGRVIEKSELMEAVWPDTTVEEVGLARNISQLRKALGEKGDAAEYVETLPKRGYRFVGKVITEPRRAGTQTPPLRLTLRGIWSFLFAAGVVCVGLGLIYWQFYRPSRYLRSGERIAHVAVVPFECLSPELDCYAFPRGLTDLLVARLSQIDGIHVLSQSTVYSYQRARLSMAFMARILGMDAILEGSVQHVEDRVRITARLVDAHSATLIWSDSYEYPANQSANAQGLAAKAIASQVGAHLTARDQAGSERR